MTTPELPDQQFPYEPDANVVKSRSVAHTIGLVLVGLLAVFGLFALAAVVMFVMALNSWGSNK